MKISSFLHENIFLQHQQIYILANTCNILIPFTAWDWSLTCISYYDRLDDSKELMCESLLSVSSLMHSNVSWLEPLWAFTQCERERITYKNTLILLNKEMSEQPTSDLNLLWEMSAKKQIVHVSVKVDKNVGEESVCSREKPQPKKSSLELRKQVDVRFQIDVNDSKTWLCLVSCPHLRLTGKHCKPRQESDKCAKWGSYHLCGFLWPFTMFTSV